MANARSKSDVLSGLRKLKPLFTGRLYRNTNYKEMQKASGLSFADFKNLLNAGILKQQRIKGLHNGGRASRYAWMGPLPGPDMVELLIHPSKYFPITEAVEASKKETIAGAIGDVVDPTKEEVEESITKLSANGENFIPLMEFKIENDYLTLRMHRMLSSHENTKSVIDSLFTKLEES